MEGHAKSRICSAALMRLQWPDVRGGFFFHYYFNIHALSSKSRGQKEKKISIRELSSLLACPQLTLPGTTMHRPRRGHFVCTSLSGNLQLRPLVIFFFLTPVG